MWILLSMLVALASLFGYHGTAAGERVQSASSHSAGPDLPRLRTQSGSGPVGTIKT